MHTQVTLLTAEPELQYIALRNISLIVAKRDDILQNDIRAFFCKYNDPIYVKMEKLEIMIKLVSVSMLLAVSFVDRAHWRGNVLG